MSTDALTVRQRAAQKTKGEAWFDALPREAKGELGDALVLGTFDWRDWGLAEKPSHAFLEGADEARMRWEQEASA